MREETSAETIARSIALSDEFVVLILCVSELVFFKFYVDTSSEPWEIRFSSTGRYHTL